MRHLRWLLLFSSSLLFTACASEDDGTDSVAAGGGPGTSGSSGKGGSGGKAGGQGGGGGEAGSGASGQGGSSGKGGSAGQGGSAGGSAGQGGSSGQGGGSGQGGSAGAQGGSAGSPSAEGTANACSDGVDNDGDNFVDCNDFDCCELVDCSGEPTSACAKGENSAAKCQDGQDNDGDNFVDCEDKNCCGLVACGPATYCGKQGQGGGGQGGSAGAGGSSGQGGSAGTGGSAGQGGSSGNGGSSGTGGSSGAGGSAGSGGSGTAAELTPGDPLRVLLIGTVLGPSGAFDGQVLVDNDKIVCVEPGQACAGQPAAKGATVITTHGIISPGLIDMHNHILYDIFDNDDWVPAKLYGNHNQWTAEARYQAMGDVKQCLEDASQGKPSWCPAKWDNLPAAQQPADYVPVDFKCEMNKWGETKAMVAGTTSVVGLIGQISGCVGSLARSIGTDHDDLPGDTIQSSALVPSSASSANNVCKNFASGATKAYVIHNGEGKPDDPTAAGEFEKLRALTDPPGCLFAPQTTITHAVAYTPAQFQEMGQKGMKMVWSPRSNISLYGVTANVPAALAANITIALGPDWSMGGSVNMLDELRFADKWDNDNFGDILSPKQLFEMATLNAAKALALEDQIGSLKAGLYADLFVFGGDPAAPYDALLAARPSSVRLTMVGGRILYGDPQLKAAAPAPGSCEDLAVCGNAKFVCVAESISSSKEKLTQTFATITSSLEDALKEVDSLTPADGWNFAPLAPLTTCP